MFCFRVKGCLPTLSVRGGAAYSRPDSFYIEKDKEKIKNIRETLKQNTQPCHVYWSKIRMTTDGIAYSRRGEKGNTHPRIKHYLSLTVTN